MDRDHPPSLDIRAYLRHLPSHQKNAVFKKPVEVGAFSIDGKRKFHNDRSQLAYIESYSNLAPKMDLNDAYSDRFTKRDENIKERLDHLLRWVVCSLHRFNKSGGDESLGPLPDFVLWRGHMTKVMCTPYENRDGWEMAAQKIGSTIYISEVETAAAEKNRLNRTKKEKLMMYWGVQFEKYMTRPTPGSDKQGPGLPAKMARRDAVDQTKVVVNTNEAYCTVVRGQINSHSILHSAEVDCCHSSSRLVPPDNYIELKTSREFSVQKQEDNFHKFKTKKWWAQSFLAGVPQITCGFRDDNGVVVRVQDFRTLDLPRMARGVPGGGWDANVCLQFLDAFFTHVKDTVNASGDGNVFLFTWSPDETEILCQKHATPTKHEFLPEWYTTSLKYSSA